MLRYLTFCMSTAVATQVGAVGATSHMTEVQPASYVTDTGDTLRVESAEFLRILGQQAAAAACFIYNDIDHALSKPMLVSARDAFDLHHAALLNGNDTLGIVGGEERRKTIAKLDAIGLMWAEMRGAVNTILNDPKNAAAVQVIKSKNLELLEMTDILVSEVEAQYANPVALMQADALMMEIVGRQAMMTQKIAKDACKIFSGNTSAELKENLATSIGIYEMSLTALIDGMPELGIKAAPTPQIATALAEVQADWQGTRQILQALLSGATVDRDQQVYLFEHMVDEMVRLEEVLHLYVTYSKHAH